jgi:aminobenzoyl-glutamate utilization protein B
MHQQDRRNQKLVRQGPGASPTVFLAFVFLLGAFPLRGASDPGQSTKEKEEAFRWIDGNKDRITGWSDRIWQFAELPMEEFQSARLLTDVLEKEGFRVERGVAGMPTAFVATYGSGEPVLGFLAEYDSLPGLSQQAVPHQEPLTEGGAGHGCGHNLLGAGSTAAAMAVKRSMEAGGLKGTIQLFGCPNEENDIGKTFMAKAGLFNSLSAAVDWHPGSVNSVPLGGSHAIHNFTVAFKGKTAHAGADPWEGRSALDGVEIMNVAVNFLREHVKPTVRIQYAITSGGKVPNIVPDTALAWYNCRDVTIEGSDAIFKRIRRIAEAAAAASETQVEVKLLTAIHQLLVLDRSSQIMQRNLELVGPPGFTAEDQEYARKVQQALGISQAGLHDAVLPLTAPGNEGFGGGGTDVAEVSWNAPVLRLNVATNPLGAPGHSWAVVCTGSMAIGHKGMLAAAKVLAATVLDLLTQPKLLEEVRAEWRAKTKGIPYQSPLPADARPPVVPEPKKGY